MFFTNDPFQIVEIVGGLLLVVENGQKWPFLFVERISKDKGQCRTCQSF